MLLTFEQAPKVEAHASALENPYFNTEKENCYKRKVAAHIAGEAIAMRLEEASTSGTSSATWRAVEIKTFHLSCKQKSYYRNC